MRRASISFGGGDAKWVLQEVVDPIARAARVLGQKSLLTDVVQFRSELDLRSRRAHGGSAFAVVEMAGDGNVTSHRYFNFDHLGSTGAISDEEGHVGNTSGSDSGVLSYDPWGARRAPDGSPADPASFNLQVGHREFTGHETIPEVGLVNMNGRVYDPMIGRFLSPDSSVQTPNDLQDYNRYSYVLNNPLSFTAPTASCCAHSDGADLSGYATGTAVRVQSAGSYIMSLGPVLPSSLAQTRIPGTVLLPDVPIR